MTKVDDMFKIIYDWMYYAKVDKTQFVRKGLLYKVERVKVSDDSPMNRFVNSEVKSE